MGTSSFVPRKMSSSVGRRKTLNRKQVMYYNQVSLHQKPLKEKDKYFTLKENRDKI